MHSLRARHVSVWIRSLQIRDNSERHGVFQRKIRANLHSCAVLLANYVNSALHAITGATQVWQPIPRLYCLLLGDSFVVHSKQEE